MAKRLQQIAGPFARGGHSAPGSKGNALILIYLPVYTINRNNKSYGN
jgi:hypothetical protein